jgi:hypothetical protein
LLKDIEEKEFYHFLEQLRLFLKKVVNELSRTR